MGQEIAVKLDAIVPEGICRIHCLQTVKHAKHGDKRSLWNPEKMSIEVRNNGVLLNERENQWIQGIRDSLMEEWGQFKDDTYF